MDGRVDWAAVGLWALIVVCLVVFWWGAVDMARLLIGWVA